MYSLKTRPLCSRGKTLNWIRDWKDHKAGLVAVVKKNVCPCHESNPNFLAV
jgi:hypothetical protein